MGRSTIQKISKNTELNNTINEQNLTLTEHTTRVQYMFFSHAHRTYAMTDHILGHKTNFNKFKRIEIIQSIFSGHYGIKQEINRKITGKSINTWKITKHLYIINGSKRKSQGKERNNGTK